MKKVKCVFLGIIIGSALTILVTWAVPLSAQDISSSIAKLPVGSKIVLRWIYLDSDGYLTKTEDGYTLNGPVIGPMYGPNLPVK